MLRCMFVTLFIVFLGNMIIYFDKIYIFISYILK